MSEIKSILDALAAEPGEPAALATLVGVEGSSYRRPGARLLLRADGRRIGSISGGCLEEEVHERARRVLATGRAELAVFDTTAENDLVWGVGLGCQGVVRIFIERLPAPAPAWVGQLRSNFASRRETALAVHFGGENPTGSRLATELPAEADDPAIFRQTIAAPPALIVFGAGDDAQPLVRIAREIGWHVSVADSRPAYATTARFPGAAFVTAAPIAGLVDKCELDGRSFVVVMTHRYADDFHLLRALLDRPMAYLGLLGPRKRTDRLLSQLRTEGFVTTPDFLARLHAPVGLDLGADTPEIIALSIVAEIQVRMAKRVPGFLRERDGPIHA